MNSARPIGSVRCDGVLISVSAMMNSSQAALKVNMATVASAGTDSGAISLVSTLMLPAPSTRKDSSSSRGMASKKPRSRKIENGRFWLT
jgi:hypothetical protein